AVRAGGVHALAHITGGGLSENIPRVLPEGMAAEIDLDTFTLPPVFGWLMQQGGIAPTEMLKTFNCGIGMVLVVSSDAAEQVTQALMDEGEKLSVLGHVVVGEGVIYSGELA
ncbi:MAG: AIR synthase-related protein, partial [Pseudomonadota bacterium]